MTEASEKGDSGAVLVTGVAGFIGAAVAQALLARGRRVIGIDSLHTGHRGHVPEDLEFIEGDLRLPETLDPLRERRIEQILHIAGQSGGEPSYDDPVFDLQANTQSTLLLLLLARAVDCRRFVYTSSVSVYGEQDHGPDGLTEDMVPQPGSLYGVGKLASEHYLRLYADQFGLDCIALRLFNIYGPGQNLANLRQGMISIYLAQALENQHIHVRGARDRYRDFVHIHDAVDAVLAAADAPLDGYHVFNVCSGVATRVEQVIEQLQDALPGSVSVDYSGATPGDVHGWLGNPAAIKRALGWTPSTDLADGLRGMIDWALAASGRTGSGS